MIRFIKSTIICLAVLLTAVAFIDPSYADMGDPNPGELGKPIVLEYDVTSNEYDIIPNGYTYFRFTPPRDDYYCFRFNDGLKFDYAQLYGPGSNRQMTFENGEYCKLLYANEEYTFEVDPYPNGEHEGTSPICSKIYALAHPRNDMTDGLYKERATPAQVGKKTRQSQLEDLGTVILGGWFIADLKGGQRYQLSVYRKGKVLSPGNTDVIWSAHVYSADGDEKEVKVKYIYNDRSKDSDDEIVFTPPKNGPYYIRLQTDDRLLDYDLLISEDTLTVNGKITCEDAPIKGSYTSSYYATVANRTSASIKLYTDLYDSDGKTLLSLAGEPLASGHTFTETLSSCVSLTVEGDLNALAQFKGYSIASDNKSITFKYRKVDGLAGKCEHIQKHDAEGSFCDGLGADQYINGTDADITGRVVLYSDNEHSSIVCDQGGYTYQYDIPAYSAVRIFDDTAEMEKGTPEYELNKVIVFERHEYDEANHSVTDYYHTLSGNITPLQRQDLHEFSTKCISDINDFKSELPAEIEFRYLDPQYSGIRQYRYDDITSYLFTETPYIKTAGIRTSRYYSEGPLSVASQLRVKDLYLDEACTASAVQREDEWIRNGEIYAKLGFETVATYDCGGALGRKEITLSETPDEESIVVKVKLIQVTEPSAAAVDQINLNKNREKQIAFSMTDLKGLNADILSTSAIYSRLSNVKAFAGSKGAAAYDAFVGDSGLAVEGGYADERYYCSRADGVDILGSSDVMLGASIVSNAFYMLGDVFYGTADIIEEEPFEAVKADNLFCISVDKTAPDKCAAAEERIRNYFRNTENVAVEVSKLSPAELAKVLNARYLDENEDYRQIKAAYFTGNGIALYSHATNTSASYHIATISLPYKCKKMVEPALATADKQGQVSYMEYEKYTSSDEVADILTAKTVDCYPLYRIRLSINGESFERIYLINGASADDIAALDEEALAYYEDSDTEVILQADDGNIPVDTAAVIEDLDESVFVSANPDELSGKDVNVFDVTPYSSATGALTDLQGSEVSVMLPIGEDSTAQIYCFDDDGNITETLPVAYYDEIDGTDYAVFRADHFSIYGSAEKQCEHVIEWVDLDKASFVRAGLAGHYECEICARCFRDENGTDRVSRKELNIPRATAKLSKTTLTYNGKAQKPAVSCTGLKKDVDYKVSYPSGRKKVGSYTVTVKGIGNYSGETKLHFRIIPATPSVKGLTAGSKRLTVNAGVKPSAKGAKYYQIAYKQKGTSKWKTVNVKARSKTIKSLKKGKQYYVRIRAYSKVSGKTYYSAWSKTKLSKKIK